MLRRIAKILFILIVCFLVLVWGITLYAKHSAKQKMTQQDLDEVISKIKTAPELPENFKNTYKKVYPGVFETNLNASFLKTILRYKKVVYPPSREVAYLYHSVHSQTNSIFKNRMIYMGFVYIVEENVSQEKCFEYTMSHFDFLNEIKGIDNAAKFYYNKPLDSLSLDEQLGLIVSLDNPSMYNLILHPEIVKGKVEKTKKELNL